MNGPFSQAIREFFAGKRVLVTGGVGTVGSALVAQLVGLGADEVRVFDNNESGLFLLGERYRDVPSVRTVLGDVRDAIKVRRAMAGCQVVLHAAAFKHVFLCEYNPFDAVQTNINGVQNVAESALDEPAVEMVLFTSSDKAVNPTNVMGTSKLLGERLMTAANQARKQRGPIFFSSRFGNVVGSRGSVVPVFAEQIQKGGPVTLTDPRMTRFVMTVEEAAHLVLASCTLARGGEVFITKMPVLRIADLARVMIDELAPRAGRDPGAIEIVEVGAKPGEKLYEELMTDAEVPRSLDIGSMFATLPAIQTAAERAAFQYPVGQTAVDRPYVSATEEMMDLDQVRGFLGKAGCLHDGCGDG